LVLAPVSDAQNLKVGVNNVQLRCKSREQREKVADDMRQAGVGSVRVSLAPPYDKSIDSIDSHDPKGPSMDGADPVCRGYGIPYRVLIPRLVDRLIVAGRCISAERRALASARITGTCMAVGQAAGTAAALSAESTQLPRYLQVRSLQRVL
jgi:hypothetical protein